MLAILLTVTGVVPSVYVILHGAVPVNAIEIVVEFPLQIVAVPVMVAVGRGLTVITTGVVTSAGQAPLETAA